jgi:hypothetical protein
VLPHLSFYHSWFIHQNSLAVPAETPSSESGEFWWELAVNFAYEVSFFVPVCVTFLTGIFFLLFHILSILPPSIYFFQISALHPYVHSSCCRMLVHLARLFASRCVEHPGSSCLVSSHTLKACKLWPPLIPLLSASSLPPPPPPNAHNLCVSASCVLHYAGLTGITTVRTAGDLTQKLKRRLH